MELLKHLDAIYQEKQLYANNDIKHIIDSIISNRLYGPEISFNINVFASTLNTTEYQALANELTDSKVYIFVPQGTDGNKRRLVFTTIYEEYDRLVKRDAERYEERKRYMEEPHNVMLEALEQEARRSFVRASFRLPDATARSVRMEETVAQPAPNQERPAELANTARIENTARITVHPDDADGNIHVDF